MDLQKSYLDLKLNLNSKKETLIIKRLSADLNNLIRNPSERRKILRGDDLFLFELGEQLLQCNLKSEKHKEKYRELLYEFLNFFRSTTLLKLISNKQNENKWLKLLLSIIKKSNYTIGHLFEQRVHQYKNKSLFQEINGEKITKHSWKEIHHKVHAIAGSLLKLQSKSKGNTRVALLCENSLEMVCLDLACLVSGIVNVFIPRNSVTQTVEYILNQSQADILFLSEEKRLPELLERLPELKYLQKIILLKKKKGTAEKVSTFTNFLEYGSDLDPVLIKQAIDEVKVSDLATIMYTSGTTEAPKGIMFSQLNLISKRFARALALPEISDKDRFLCYLPLFHTFGRFFEMLGCVFWGCSYTFVESAKIETLIRNMQLIKPTTFISIPKKWSQMYEKAHDDYDDKHTVSEITGGRLKWGLSAAGYLDPDIFQFFQENGVELMSGFGMTEATGGITMTPPFKYKQNSVGQALPGIEIRLTREGEMKIRGPYVMSGYLDKLPKRKPNDWFHTGDIFSKDSEGNYQILDRKKEIYKNSKGETISPQKIENLFQDFESVKSVFLVGDHREFNTLLLYPNFEYPEVNFSKLTQKKLREFFSSVIVSVNRFLAPYERIVDFTVIDRNLIIEKNERTAKGTYKRKIVEENFAQVINPMYEQDFASLKKNGFEIRIPNWLLREKGLTADDFRLEKSDIVMIPSKKRITFKMKNGDLSNFRLGTFNYSCEKKFIDLGHLINDVGACLGNLEFVNFIGEEILLRSSSKSSNIKLLNHIGTKKADPRVCRKLNRLIKQGVKNEHSIHLAAYILYTNNLMAVSTAILHLESVILDRNETTLRLAESVLFRTAVTNSLTIRQLAFQTLILNEQRDRIEPIFETFLLSDKTVLNKTIITKIVEQSFSKNKLKGILLFLKNLRDQLSAGKQNFSFKNIDSMLNLVTEYGIKHPLAFKNIRIELTKWALGSIDEKFQKKAAVQIDKLTSGFRNWLGSNQLLAIDPDTTKEYGWKDVVVFEDSIAADDKALLFSAIKNFPILREAIFLFVGKALVRLQDIPNKGVRIGFLGERHGKIVYRISIKTRNYGSFDLAINLNKSLSQETVKTETDWLICTCAAEGSEPLVEDFGGYWRNNDLWTEEYIPGDTVESLVKKMAGEPEEAKRIELLWPYLVWSGTSAYIGFWNKTGRSLEIADPTPANVIVPIHDYQTGFRIVSISRRRKFKSTTSLILSLKKNFIDSVESKHPNLKGKYGVEIIFSSLLEILGEQEGIKILEKILTGLRSRKNSAILSKLRSNITHYLKAVEKSGFLPKRLFLAIQRFHRWHKLNPTATTQAKLSTLNELKTTYTLQNLEHKFPGVRLQLFRDTLFFESSSELQEELNQIIKQLKSGILSEENLQQRCAQLSIQFKLSDVENLFVTRMAYPHLGPTDTAEVVSLDAAGSLKSALIVFVEDNEGHQFGIREAATPKEIARLHKLFNHANLAIEFQPEHRYLVVLNEKMRVVAGLFYRETDERHVHMEKIVVDEHYRQKTIADLLLKEFFNRLTAHGFEYVTVGFLRSQFFGRYGFKIDQRFGNMVKKLDSEEKKKLPMEL